MTTQSPKQKTYLVDSDGLFSAAESRELLSWRAGLTVEQAARANHVSPNTVKTHRAAISQKTGQRGGISVIHHCFSFGYIRSVDSLMASFERRQSHPTFELTQQEGARL